MAIFEIGSTPASARRIGWGAGGAFLAALIVWLAAYASGAFPWLGYAWLDRASFGAGPFTVVGEDQAGTSFGTDSFVFFQGQEIVIDYYVEIRAGSLMLYVYDLGKTGQGLGPSRYLTESGAGVWTYIVPRTGLYRIVVAPSTAQGAGSGFDLSYRVWWGARPAA